jgi:hypothetical protein
MIKIFLKVWIIVFLTLFAGQMAKAQDSIPEKQEIALADSTGIGKPANDSISIKSDSVHSDNIDAPVYMTAKDSMVMVMDSGNILYLYGSGTAKYKDFSLEAENIQKNADSSKLYAHFGLDSVKTKFGFPKFKTGEQQTEMEEVWYNFKTKKMYTQNVITQQGDGYVTAGVAKRMPDESFYLRNGKYTTCDNHEHPHFYLNLTRAKFQQGKNTITGPAYLVVEDVPLPIAIPFGFFPSSKSYSSGVLMPTYGDEMARGFSLRDGGYYFAFSDYVDLALTGEIYTKGSWGLSASSNYVKHYKYAGRLDASYLVTITGDKDSKDLPNSDYSKAQDIKVTWTHRQDPKSNPNGTFSAGINFSTSSFNRNDFGSTRMSDYTQNTKASSVSYSYRPLAHPLFSISASASINQRSQDSTLSVSFPDMTISLTGFYPFKRKEQIGSERWYEKIYLNYTGTIKNSINNVKESQFFEKSIKKDWKNGIKHSIPISASFNLLKYITISTSAQYDESWYLNRTNYRYDYDKNAIAPRDTAYGFFRAYDYSGSVSMNTKLYGMYKPWSLLGKWAKGVQIRHVLTPSITFNGSPDFSDPKFGMYQLINVSDDLSQPKFVRQSHYANNIGGPTAGRTGAVSFRLANNLEAKVPIAGTDSTKKISLIDNFELNTAYNFLADSMNWSNIGASLRLKLFGSSINLTGAFDTYTYGPNGQPVNVPRWKVGKFPRFTGTSSSYSYTLNNESLKKLFHRGGGKDSGKDEAKTSEGTDETRTTDETGENKPATGGSLLQTKKEVGNYDADGYLASEIQWSLSANYSINFGYNKTKFNKDKLEYPYKFSQTLGFSGNISPTKAWQVSFNASYDFDTRRIVNMFCSITRQMHCWSMSASVVPIGPYQNYSFSIAVNSSLLKDIKYQQSSTSRDALNWGE